MTRTGDRRERAAALRYKASEARAPRVVAKGSGWLARRMIREAREHGIPVREDPLLVEVLMGLDLYREIPQELYQVIAEIYVFLYRLKQAAGSSR